MLKRFDKKVRRIIGQPATFFVIVGLFIGLVFTITSPPGFGLDERAHFMRTYLISNGEFFPGRIGPDHHIGAYFPVNLVGFVGASTADLLDNNQSVFQLKRHDADLDRYKPYFSQPFSEQKVDDRSTNEQELAAYAYSPLGYLHMALVVKVGEVLKLPLLINMYLARLVNLVLYLWIVYVAIKLMPRYKWLLASVALLPTAIYQASTVSVDPVVNALSFLAFALFIKLWFEPSEERVKPHIYILVLAVFAGLALTKAPYVLLLLPYLFITAKKFKTPRLSYLLKAGWAAGAGLFALSWVVVNRDITPSLVKLQPGFADMHLQMQYVLHHPIHFIQIFLRTHYESIDHTLESLLGRAGDRQVGLPNAFMYIFSTLSVGLTYIFHRKENWPQRRSLWFSTLLFVTVGAVIGLVSLTLYITFTPVGATTIQGIQGRYFLPVLPFAMLLIFHVFPFKLQGSQTLARTIIQSSSTVFLCLTALIYFLVNY